jgi:hypothetical protein
MAQDFKPVEDPTVLIPRKNRKQVFQELIRGEWVAKSNTFTQELNPGSLTCLLLASISSVNQLTRTLNEARREVHSPGVVKIHLVENDNDEKSSGGVDGKFLVRKLDSAEKELSEALDSLQIGDSGSLGKLIKLLGTPRLKFAYVKCLNPDPAISRWNTLVSRWNDETPPKGVIIHQCKPRNYQSVIAWSTRIPRAQGTHKEMVEGTI